jgi:acyl carrier protein
LVEQTQAKLATLWCDLLECREATADSDFFDCGGTSLTAVHLAARIQETFSVSVDAIEVVVERKLGRMSDLIALRLAGSPRS